MAKSAVYKYMKMQNRPYSVNNMVTNLNNEYNKAAVQKAMDQLVKDGQLFVKVYDKQKIYCVCQDAEYDTDELVRIDKEQQSHASDVENKYQEVVKEMKKQDALLDSLKSSLSLEDARKEKLTLSESVKQLTQRLNDLKRTTGDRDLRESKRKAEKELDEYKSQYLKRKRMCVEIIDCILGNYSGSKEELYDEVGIDPTTIK